MSMSTWSEQRVRVALDVLEYCTGLKLRAPNPEEIAFLRSCADGELEAGLTLDELACSVIRRELLHARQLSIETGRDILKRA